MSKIKVTSAQPVELPNEEASAEMLPEAEAKMADGPLCEHVWVTHANVDVCRHCGQPRSEE